jgi:hypothetical protein
LPEKFRIKVTTIKKIKNLYEMKVEELVGSLLTYELSLPHVKKVKSIVLKIAKGKSKISPDEEIDDEDGLAMFARNFSKLMKSKRFKNKKFVDNFQGNPKGTEQEKMKLTKRILVVLSVMNVQVLSTSKQIVETSSKLKTMLSYYPRR